MKALRIGMELYVRIALLLAVGLTNLSTEGTAQRVIFENGASSTGWLNFEFQDGKRILVPAKINGHDTKVLLITGLPVSDIDKAFATSIGVRPKDDPEALSSSSANSTALLKGIRIQIGGMTLPGTTASPVDFRELSKRVGYPLTFLLGDDAFAELSVDIDFRRHRIVFSKPATQSKPRGAVELPLIRVDGIPLVPVSIEGAPPAEFELGLGNSGELLVYQSYYESHKLLLGRKISKRLAGGTGGFIEEPVGTLEHIDFAGVTFGRMPAAFILQNLAGTVPSIVAGDLGLPILARFRLILDYSHKRLYLVPYGNAALAPFPKDRLGLFLTKEGDGFLVQFVAPDSPAVAAGFKVGDKITHIDGKPAEAWPGTSFTDVRYGATGTNLIFTMHDGSIRRVKLADYF